jgi:hypothetical protein
MTYEPTNLTMRREGTSVWDKQATANSRCRTMAITGFLMIATGVVLVAQGYRTQLGWAMKRRMSSLRFKRAGDQVMHASEQSFPASDPPAWTPSVGKAAPLDPAF